MPAKGRAHFLPSPDPGHDVHVAREPPDARGLARGEHMETSIYLAKLIGPIYLVVAIGLLLNQEHYRSVAKEFAASPALFYLSGIIALIIGGLIVLLHNVWSGWPIVVTLLGWAAIAKGAVRTLVPTWATGVVGKMTANANALTATGLAALALGAYLTAMGYWLGPLG
jgi:hypothetical protein